jgi:hypothetical protein
VRETVLGNKEDGYAYGVASVGLGARLVPMRAGVVSRCSKCCRNMKHWGETGADARRCSKPVFQVLSVHKTPYGSPPC